MPGCDHGLVSVLMSVYNGAPTLEKAAASVLAQTYRDLELILCDDASTDDTWRIMQRIAAQDARVTVFQNKTNRGLGASLNGCLSRAGGEYIARQDADDISDPDRIERTTDFLLSSGAPYAACGVRVFDDGGIWSTRQYPQKITKHIIAQKNPFFHPTMVFRRAVLEGVGGYSETPETRRTEDYDLVMRLAAEGVIGENLPEILYSVYEPKEAYLRHNAKTRLCEVRVRARGLRAMGSPASDYIYLVKPLIMACVPRGMMRSVKRLQWKLQSRDTKK